MSAKLLMFQGVGSNVGKSVMTKTTCRYLLKKNIDVNTFKPFVFCENPIKSNNINTDIRMYASVLACEKNITYDNNPFQVIVKNNNNAELLYKNQRIFDVKVISRDLIDYTILTDNQRLFLKEKINLHLNRLRRKHDFIIIEGAGNPTDLGSIDIANQYISEQFNPDIILITNISNGGALSSLIGTYLLTPEYNKKNILGYIVNGTEKNHIDYQYFENKTYNLTNMKCLGYFPDFWRFISQLSLEEQIKFLEEKFRSNLHLSLGGLIK